MNQIHFVVTEGEYSSYHIKRVFSDRALAESYIKIYGGEIEEWPDSEAVPDPYLWEASISPRGEIETRPLSVPEEDQCRYGELFNGEQFWMTGNGYALKAHGRTKEEAIRIAGDYLKAALAKISPSALQQAMDWRKGK